MGKNIDSHSKEIIYNIIQFCEREKAAGGPTIQLQKVTDRVVAMTGLSRDTVSRIKKEGATNNGEWRTPGTIRQGRPKKIVLNDSDKSALRNKIRQFYASKESPTLRKLHQMLIKELNFNGGLTSLREVLKELGFAYKKCGNKQKKVLTEKSEKQEVDDDDSDNKELVKLILDKQ